MNRHTVWIAPVLALVATSGASAAELPLRKPGLWEMKMVRSGSDMPEMTMQHCTDETVDRDLTNVASPMGKQVCSKQTTEKTATGFVVDTVCTVGGMTTTARSEISGDFNSAYTVKTSSHSKGGSAGAGRDMTATFEAKWIGACKADQKPGDVVMPGGFKVNIRDAKSKAQPPR